MLKRIIAAAVTGLLIASVLIGPASALAGPMSVDDEADPVAVDTTGTGSEIVYAEEITQDLAFSAVEMGEDIHWQLILDGANTSRTVIPAGFFISVESLEPIGGVYVEADEPVGAIHILFEGERIDRTENTCLHFFTDGFETKALTFWFDQTATITDVHFFSVGEKPDYVQTWSPTLERADVLLLPAHYDDELLYFGGIIPWCIERGASVTVAFFCKHDYEEFRKHEVLDGLWEAGIRNYPILGEYHDSGPIPVEDVLWRLQYDGYVWEDLLERQVYLYRRFKPQVVLTHSEDGEYGHGQHVLYEQLAVAAAELSGDPACFPDSAGEYGAYEVPKLYVHDYISDHGQIVLDLDQPLESRGGMSSYEVTVAAFKKHPSQEDYFYNWLEVPRRASQIGAYSPCRWGLYRTNVGDDTSTDTFFDNITLLCEKDSGVRSGEGDPVPPAG